MRFEQITQKDIFNLVSGSPRRRWLISLLPLKVNIIGIDSDSIEKPSDGVICPHCYARENSRIKALHGIGYVKKGYILACDTVVFCQGHVLGKPADHEQAFYSLKSLSGITHSVISSITLYDTVRDKLWTDSEESLVSFREIPDQEINDYIDSGEPFGKAGSYALQGHASQFLADIRGTKSNVYGLPLKTLVSMILRVKSESIRSL